MIAALIAGAIGGAGNARADNVSTYSQAVLGDAPIGYWRLGERSGSFIDSTTGGHAGQEAYYSSSGDLLFRHDAGAVDDDNGAIFSDAAPSGYALRPNGAYAAIDTGSDARYQLGGRSAFSLEAWVNPAARAEAFNGGIVGNFTMNSCGCFDIGYGLYMTYPDLKIKFVRSGEPTGASFTALTSSQAVAADEWTHIVGTYDGTEMRLYINGQLDVSVVSTQIVYLNGTTVRIGMFMMDYGATDYPGYFAGTIDDVAIYDRAISSSQIAHHSAHRSPFLTPEEPAEADAAEAPAESTTEPALPPEPDPVDSADPDAPNDGAVGGFFSLSSRAARVRALTGSSGVTWSQTPDALTVRNADGKWTIYKRCIDTQVNGLRYNVGPGYIARLVDSQGRTIVDDYVGRSIANTGNANELNEPGYINSVNGGLGAFGWHHARGTVGATPSGDDPTTSAVESSVGHDPKAIEGRMCASTNGGAGVYARNYEGLPP